MSVGTSVIPCRSQADTEGCRSHRGAEGQGRGEEAGFPGILRRLPQGGPARGQLLLPNPGAGSYWEKGTVLRRRAGKVTHTPRVSHEPGLPAVPHTHEALPELPSPSPCSRSSQGQRQEAHRLPRRVAGHERRDHALLGRPARSAPKSSVTAQLGCGGRFSEDDCSCVQSHLRDVRGSIRTMATERVLQ